MRRLRTRHRQRVPLRDKTICVANGNGACSAMGNVCPHRGGPLGAGVILNGRVVCPWHGWEGDSQTGAAVHNADSKVLCIRRRLRTGTC
jgi:nitrite reductase (NADH) small subunit